MRLSAREGDETSKAKIRMSVGMLLGCVYRVIQQSREDRAHARKNERVKSLTDARANLFVFRRSITNYNRFGFHFPANFPAM